MRIYEFTQSLNDAIIESIQWHQQNKVPLTENVFRYGSDAYFQFFNAIRELVKENNLQLTNDIDRDIIDSDLGQFGIYEGKEVPLDCIFQEPLEEAEYHGKTVQINKPKRSSGGPKKYYVYVKNPKTGNVKKINFGDVSGGLTAKIGDPKRRKAFASRHSCETKTNKLSSGYWSCRLPRFAKSLGLAPVHAQWW